MHASTAEQEPGGTTALWWLLVGKTRRLKARQMQAVVGQGTAETAIFMHAFQLLSFLETEQKPVVAWRPNAQCTGLFSIFLTMRRCVLSLPASTNPRILGSSVICSPRSVCRRAATMVQTLDGPEEVTDLVSDLSTKYEAVSALLAGLQHIWCCQQRAPDCCLCVCASGAQGL